MSAFCPLAVGLLTFSTIPERGLYRDGGKRGPVIGYQVTSPPTQPGIYAEPRPDQRFGRRALTDTEIDALAKALVKEIRNRFAFPEAEVGAMSYGSLGIVKQGDIHTPIAPVLSARSDSSVTLSVQRVIPKVDFLTINQDRLPEDSAGF